MFSGGHACKQNWKPVCRTRGPCFVVLTSGFLRHSKKKSWLNLNPNFWSQTVQPNWLIFEGLVRLCYSSSVQSGGHKMRFFSAVSPCLPGFALEMIKNPRIVLAVFANTIFQNSWPVLILLSFSLSCFAVNEEPACLGEAAGFMQSLWWKCWWNNCSAMLERVNSKEFMSQGTKTFCYCTSSLSSISSEEMVALCSRGL